MSAALLLALAIAGPPSNGADLAAEVAALATRQEHLPLAFAADVLPRLQVVLHEQRGGLAMAFYAPALTLPVSTRTADVTGGDTDGKPAAPEGSEAGPDTAVGVEEAEPLGPPRLMLYEPYYRRTDGAWVEPLEMTPDVVEYWCHALLLAHLHLEVVEGDGEYGAFVRRRAAAYYPEVEPEAAVGLMVTALASFGSHVLSLANEIERARRRRPDADLCGLVRARKLHFAAWARAFGDEEYVGVAGEAAGEAYPRRAIAKADKQAFVQYVLEGRWSGDPEVDFGRRLCAASRDESQR